MKNWKIEIEKGWSKHDFGFLIEWYSHDRGTIGYNNKTVKIPASKEITITLPFCWFRINLTEKNYEGISISEALEEVSKERGEE